MIAGPWMLMRLPSALHQSASIASARAGLAAKPTSVAAAVAASSRKILMGLRSVAADCCRSGSHCPAGQGRAPSQACAKRSVWHIFDATGKDLGVVALMGTWGTGLYSGDFATDLRAVVAAASRLPLDEERLVKAICDTAKSAAENPADEDHAIVCLVPAHPLQTRR